MLHALLPAANAGPHELHQAMRCAVFPGGKRLRPRLLLVVADACANGCWEPDQIELALRASGALELIHCASLVHDDLPSFDDAPVRRGEPTIHRAFGEPMAILAGDALLIRAFEALGDAPASRARQALALVRLLARATGSVEGIIGGQSLEGTCLADRATSSETYRYHAMKTGALFRLAAEAGARIGGAPNSDAWADFGLWIGMAFQLVDDLRDVHGSPGSTGKPAGRDDVLGRPNAVLAAGGQAVLARLRSLLDAARQRISALTSHRGALCEVIDDLLACGAALTTAADRQASSAPGRGGPP
jgi:geranylgeranyl diphosphate synthase type II